MAACSTSPKNYKTEGEKFLESKDLAKSAGYRYKYALCDQPQTIQVGTQYACIATDNDDNSWEFIIEITGDSSKCAAFIKILEPFGIKEMVQSGVLAMGRGSKSITEKVSK